MVFSLLTIGKTQLSLLYAITTHLNIMLLHLQLPLRSTCSHLSPPGQLGSFVEEQDVMLSSFPEEGTQLVVFGDFNIHLVKSYATDFISLLASFDLKRLITTGTDKSGNQLDLIYTRNCRKLTEKFLVKPLHVSDHFLITFNLQLTIHTPPTPLPVTFRRNLKT